ncbi:hypothetical protein [Streptomyces hydrogenans]
MWLKNCSKGGAVGRVEVDRRGRQVGVADLREPGRVAAVGEERGGGRAGRTDRDAEDAVARAELAAADQQVAVGGGGDGPHVVEQPGRGAGLQVHDVQPVQRRRGERLGAVRGGVDEPVAEEGDVGVLGRLDDLLLGLAPGVHDDGGLLGRGVILVPRDPGVGEGRFEVPLGGERRRVVLRDGGVGEVDGAPVRDAVGALVAEQRVGGGALSHLHARGALRDAGDGAAAVLGVVHPQGAGPAPGREEDRAAGEPGAPLVALPGHGQDGGARGHVPHRGSAGPAQQDVVADDEVLPRVHVLVSVDRGALPGVVPHPVLIVPAVAVRREEEARRPGGDDRRLGLDPEEGGGVGGTRRRGGWA